MDNCTLLTGECVLLVIQSNTIFALSSAFAFVDAYIKAEKVVTASLLFLPLLLCHDRVPPSPLCPAFLCSLSDEGSFRRRPLPWQQ